MCPAPNKNPICELLDIDHPLILAPMALVSGGALAKAVTEAGGLGMIGGGYGDADWLETEFANAGNARFGVGFITWSLAQKPELLELALSRNPVAIMLSFGDAAPFIPKIRAAGAKVICQVQTRKQAEEVAKLGADIIVAQGTEAGGHGAARGLASLLSSVVDAAGDIPVLAAGGITEHRDLVAAAALGAEGALIGTRFFASDEALGHPNVKDRIAASTADDTVRTTVFDVARNLDWPAPYTVRAIKNGFTQKWHGNEGELGAHKQDIIAAYPGAVAAGDVDYMGVFAGEGIDRIHDIKPAKQIFEDFLIAPSPW